MKKAQSNTTFNLDSFDFLSSELQEEFKGLIYSLDDVIIIE